MLLDENTLFSDDQAVTATAASTNYMDTGVKATVPGAPAALGGSLGNAHDIPLLIQVTAAFATLTSLTISVETDDNTSFSSAKTVASTHAILAADLVAGYIAPLNLIPHTATERYVRLKYTVGGSNATAGTITASVVPSIQTNG
jgi:hypothetical protein